MPHCFRGQAIPAGSWTCQPSSHHRRKLVRQGGYPGNPGAWATGSTQPLESLSVAPGTRLGQSCFTPDHPQALCGVGVTSSFARGLPKAAQRRRGPGFRPAAGAGLALGCWLPAQPCYLLDGTGQVQICFNPRSPPLEKRTVLWTKGVPGGKREGLLLIQRGTEESKTVLHLNSASYSAACFSHFVFTPPCEKVGQLLLSAFYR